MCSRTRRTVPLVPKEPLGGDEYRAFSCEVGSGPSGPSSLTLPTVPSSSRSVLGSACGAEEPGLSRDPRPARLASGQDERTGGAPLGSWSACDLESHWGPGIFWQYTQDKGSHSLKGRCVQGSAGGAGPLGTLQAARAPHGVLCPAWQRAERGWASQHPNLPL